MHKYLESLWSPIAIRLISILSRKILFLAELFSTLSCHVSTPIWTRPNQLRLGQKITYTHT